MHLKLVETELACIVFFIVITALLNAMVGYKVWHILFWGGLFVTLLHTWKKLFYVSLYSRNAGLWQSLPFSWRELAGSKIYVGGLLLSLTAILPTVCYGVFRILQGDYRLDSFLSTMLRRPIQFLIDQLAAPEDVPLMLALAFLAVVVGSFAVSGAMLLGVVVFESLVSSQRAALMSWLCGIVSGVLAAALIGLPVWVSAVRLSPYTIFMVLETLALGAAVLVLASWGSIRLLERHYRLG